MLGVLNMRRSLDGVVKYSYVNCFKKYNYLPQRYVHQWCAATTTPPNIYTVPVITQSNQIAITNTTREDQPNIALKNENSDPIQTFMHASVTHSADLEKIKLPNDVIKSLEKMGIKELYPTQLNSFLPIFDAQRDLLLQAPTGTGKSLAYIIPLITRILADLENSTAPHKNPIHALIILPTRELAHQTYSVLLQTTQKIPQIRVGSCIGGIKIQDDVEMLKETRPHVIVATPGRIIDHVRNTKNFRNLLSQTKTLVVDEISFFVKSGALKNALHIRNNHIHPQATTYLVSATVSEETLRVAQRSLNTNFTYLDISGQSYANPAAIDSSSASSAIVPALPPRDRLSQSYALLSASDMVPALWNLLNEYYRRDPASFKVIIFAPTVALVQFLFILFKHAIKPSFELKNTFKYIDPSDPREVKIACLHRKLSPAKRQRIYEKFKDAKNGIMFSSDLGSFGLDAKNVKLVVHWGVARDTESYLHRCGRTARNNESGDSIMLLCKGLEDQFLVSLADEQGIEGDLKSVSSDYLRDVLTVPIEPKAAKALYDTEQIVKSKVFYPNNSTDTHNINAIRARHSWSGSRMAPWVRNRENQVYFQPKIDDQGNPVENFENVKAVETLKEKKKSRYRRTNDADFVPSEKSTRRVRGKIREKERQMGADRKELKDWWADFDPATGRNVLRLVSENVGGNMHFERQLEDKIMEIRASMGGLSEEDVFMTALYEVNMANGYRSENLSPLWYHRSHMYASGALAYRSLLGFYGERCNSLRLDRDIIVDSVNGMFFGAGLRIPFRVTYRFAKKLGYWECGGLLLSHHAPRRGDLIASLPGFPGFRSRAVEENVFDY